jgi:ATP-dependent DNA helicase RecG
MERTLARRYMLHAAEVMRRSVHEIRADRKVVPSVGAVLVMSDGSVVDGARGELRSGDHAEYTVLERKCRDRPLDRATVFTTLEPCAPGARKQPKLACAERLVLARVAEVWIGIEDPDPTVDRRGISFLEANGILVEMFDPDVQDAIRIENRQFLQQALERAGQAIEISVQRPRTNPFDAAIPDADLTELSNTALKDYGTSLRHRSGF